MSLVPARRAHGPSFIDSSDDGGMIGSAKGTSDTRIRFANGMTSNEHSHGTNVTEWATNFGEIKEFLRGTIPTGSSQEDRMSDGSNSGRHWSFSLIIIIRFPLDDAGDTALGIVCKLRVHPRFRTPVNHLIKFCGGIEGYLYRAESFLTIHT